MKPRFSPQHDVRVGALPGAVGRQRPQARQVVAVGTAARSACRPAATPTRRWRTADAGRARAARRGSPAAARPSPAASRRSRSRRWRGQSRNVDVPTCDVRRPKPDSARTATGRPARCVRFIVRSRAARGGEHCAVEEALDVPEVGEHAQAAQREPYSTTRFERRRAAAARPHRRAPPWRRCRRASGSREQTAAPHSRGDVDRAARPLQRLAAPRGTAGCSRMNTRRRCRVAARNSAARRNDSSVIRLFRRASTSGCAVSRPMATSSRPPPRPRRRSGAGSARRERPAETPGAPRRSRARSRPRPRRRSRRRPRAGSPRGSKKLPALYSLTCRAGGRLASARADLRGDRAWRHRLVERVDPQVAHHAAERALAVGEEDDRRRAPSARRRRAPLPTRPRRRACGSSDAFGPRRSRTQWSSHRRQPSGQIERRRQQMGLAAFIRRPPAPSVPRCRTRRSLPASSSVGVRAAAPPTCASNTCRHQAFVTRGARRRRAPSWNRRLGLTGISTPSTARMPARTTSCFSVYEPLDAARRASARTGSPRPRR